MTIRSGQVADAIRQDPVLTILIGQRVFGFASKTHFSIEAEDKMGRAGHNTLHSGKAENASIRDINHVLDDRLENRLGFRVSILPADTQTRRVTGPGAIVQI